MVRAEFLYTQPAPLPSFSPSLVSHSSKLWGFWSQLCARQAASSPAHPVILRQHLQRASDFFYFSSSPTPSRVCIEAMSFRCVWWRQSELCTEQHWLTGFPTPQPILFSVALLQLASKKPKSTKILGGLTKDKLATKRKARNWTKRVWAFNLKTKFFPFWGEKK